MKSQITLPFALSRNAGFLMLEKPIFISSVSEKDEVPFYKTTLVFLTSKFLFTPTRCSFQVSWKQMDSSKLWSYLHISKFVIDHLLPTETSPGHSWLTKAFLGSDTAVDVTKGVLSSSASVSLIWWCPNARNKLLKYFPPDTLMSWSAKCGNG